MRSNIPQQIVQNLTETLNTTHENWGRDSAANSIFHPVKLW